MHIVILIVGLLALIVGPGLWVKGVMARYSLPKNRYTLTGGELARQLLDHLGPNAMDYQGSRIIRKYKQGIDGLYQKLKKKTIEAKDRLKEMME